MQRCKAPVGPSKVILGPVLEGLVQAKEGVAFVLVMDDVLPGLFLSYLCFIWTQCQDAWNVECLVRQKG